MVLRSYFLYNKAETATDFEVVWKAVNKSALSAPDHFMRIKFGLLFIITPVIRKCGFGSLFGLAWVLPSVLTLPLDG